MKERYKELDLMKGIAIILVFLFHSLQVGKDSFINLNDLTKIIFINAHYFMMPLFFIISGFLSNSGKEYSLKKYYINKLKRLLIPYLFINFIDFIPRTLFPNLVNSKFGGIREVLFYGTKITWFVYTLFIIFLIFPFVEKFIIKKDKYYLFGIFILFINYLGFAEKIELFAINTVVYYFIYFYLGYIIRPFYKKNIYNGIFTSNKFFVILSVVFLGLFYKFLLVNFFTKILFVLMSILFYLNITKRIKDNSEIYNLFKFFGVNSLTFYLFDGFVAVICRTIILKTISIERTALCIVLLFISKTLLMFIAIKFIVVKSSILSFLLGASVEKNN